MEKQIASTAIKKDKKKAPNKISIEGRVFDFLLFMTIIGFPIISVIIIYRAINS